MKTAVCPKCVAAGEKKPSPEAQVRRIKRELAGSFFFMGLLVLALCVVLPLFMARDLARFVVSAVGGIGTGLPLLILGGVFLKWPRAAVAWVALGFEVLFLVVFMGLVGIGLNLFRVLVEISHR